MKSNRVFESRAPRIRRKPVRHSAPLYGDPPRPVEVVARLSRRRGLAAPGRSACRRRPVSLTDDRRVRWHRPNQINIPPLRGSLRPSPHVLVPPPAFSSFLLRLRGCAMYLRHAFNSLRFQRVSLVMSLLRSRFALETMSLSYQHQQNGWQSLANYKRTRTFGSIEFTFQQRPQERVRVKSLKNLAADCPSLEFIEFAPGYSCSKCALSAILPYRGTCAITPHPLYCTTSYIGALCLSREFSLRGCHQFQRPIAFIT